MTQAHANHGKEKSFKTKVFKIHKKSFSSHLNLYKAKMCLFADTGGEEWQH